MKYKERIQMIIKKIGKLATGIALLLGTSLISSSWAGSQIYYGRDGGGDEDTTLFIFPQGSVPVSAGKVTGGIIKPLGVTLLSSPSSGTVHCRDSPFPMNQTDSEIYHNLIYSGKSYDGKPLFKTSIEGIYITVEVLNYSSPVMEFTPSSFTLPATGEVVIAGRITDASQCQNDQPISFQVRTTYYLGENYVPPEYDGTVSEAYNPFMANIIRNNSLYMRGFDSQNSPGFSVRGSTQGLGSYLVVEFNSIGLMVTAPTCYANTVAGTNVKGNTVDFGNVLTTDISNGTSNSKRQFQIALKDCVGIRSIETRLSTTKTGNSVRLLGNQQTNNAAGGIGVKITGLNDSVTGKAEQLYPNNTYSFYTEYESATNSDGWADINAIDVTHPGVEHTLDFEAQLVPDFVQDQPAPVITAGGFEATGTFSITYP
ncbi:fimbrial protein [Escherichia marmotae]|uniref:fimbrial protein n=1 Tax=Escherichia marmotae TaxID=1499973 RepID=UPI001C9B0A73|nr:fimbrial protein [Escherichia marmotae]MBY7378610.1 fimbrial protein [Escherichia marmotae]MBY7387963.1 fimbrial protein [Escherichia marmotae]MBY7486416.1 fimbrial protein [Escherichia marmotae]MBY7545687.1 fimbrial protein [Escherichia marmotae]MED9112849.1 fimbrial protein [Escherichia marmotae]